MSAISKADVLETFADLYDVFEDNKSIRKELDKVYDRLNALPSVQPEMVKCKKCRYVYYDKEFGNYWCDRMSDSFKVEADGYCKWGK